MAESKAETGLAARLRQLQSTVQRVQSEGERMVTRLRKEAAALIGQDRRRAVRDLLTQARKLSTDFQKRAERTMKDLEERGQKIRAAIERQAERSVDPLVRGLNLPTRDELDKLKKKVAQIEKRLDELVASNNRAA